MLTTAGSTRLTSGAKLCCGSVGAPCDSGGVAFWGASAAGFWAQTSGDSASVAPRPNPTAAAACLAEPGLVAGAGLMFRHASILLMHE